MSKATKQLEANIAYCIDVCDMDDEDIGEMLRAIERLGLLSVEYFCEEFIFLGEDHDTTMRYHDDEYLPIKWRLEDHEY